jgi:hypothetical protein
MSPTFILSVFLILAVASLLLALIYEAVKASKPRPSHKNFRKTETGRFIHDGDCRFWSMHICTCGLLHYLRPKAAGSGMKHEKAYIEEMAQEDDMFERLEEF